MQPAPRWWSLSPRATGPAALGIDGWSYCLPGVLGAMAFLAALRLPRRARLGLSATACPATVALLQAAPLCGITLVLISRRLSDLETRRQVQAAALDGLLTDAEHPAATLASAHMPTCFADLPWDAALLDPLAPEQAALVLFTSGTSGQPKAASLSLRALNAAAAAGCARLEIKPATTWLACLPCDHIGGAAMAYRAAVSGHRLLLCERFHTELVAMLLSQAQGISLVATMLHRLCEQRREQPWPVGLRVLLLGGGPLGDRLASRAAALGCEPCQSYGLTECCSQVCTTAPGEAAAQRGSAGRPLAGMEVQVRGADGRLVASGAVGTIEVRGAQLFSGYEEQGAVVRPQDAAAWFATGDLGSLAADGRLTVECRRDDLIISGGENVYPREVEAALERHPGVAEVAVCALPDEEWGQVVAAVVVLHSAARGGGASLETIQSWAAAQLGPHQRPRRWQLVGELPRSSLGKLLRNRLAGCFPHGAAP